MKQGLHRFFQTPEEAGTDESGRGCLAGPVTAAAVILPTSFELDGLNDSKQLPAAKRHQLQPLIEAQCSCYAIAHVGPEVIDEINILRASIQAMHQALDQLSKQPRAILVDGNRFKPYRGIPHWCMVKGDSKYLSIAAASVLAKTYRDRYMEEIHKEYPMYNWKQNKGYPTREHREAIAKYGPSKYHRKSFRLLPNQLQIQFH